MVLLSKIAKVNNGFIVFLRSLYCIFLVLYYFCVLHVDLEVLPLELRYGISRLSSILKIMIVDVVAKSAENILCYVFFFSFAQTAIIKLLHDYVMYIIHKTEERK